MGICQSTINKEVGIEHGDKIPVTIINKTGNIICKITYVMNNKKYYGTGFFMITNNSIKCLITAYHVISENFAK